MRTKFKPSIEMLEDRTVPTVSLAFSNGYAVFTGNNQEDVVRIIASTDSETGDPILTATYNGNGGTRTVAINLFETPILGAKVSLGGRGDVFRFDNRDGFDIDQSFNLYVDMGSGNDAAVALMAQDIVGDETVVNLKMLGGSGKDWLNVQMTGDIGEGATVNVDLQGGSHDDTIIVSQVGVVEGVINFLANGGSGRDEVKASFFAVAPEFEEEITANSAGGRTNVNVSLQGGAHRDTITLLVAADEGATFDANLGIVGSHDDVAYRTPLTGVLVYGIKAKNIFSQNFHSYQTI